MAALKLTEQFHVTTNIRVSTHTIQNRVHERGLGGWRPYTDIILTANHAHARIVTDYKGIKIQT